MKPDVSVIIVSYNTKDITMRCLRSLFEDLASAPTVTAEVLVVDNASTDASVDSIRREFPQVHLIANRQNHGFGAANNLAMSQANGEFFLLLNSDAFLKGGAIFTLIAELRESPKTAVLGPKLCNPDNTLQVSCYKFPSPFRAWMENLWLSATFSWHPAIGDYRRWAHDSPREVHWVIGACMLVRAQVFKQVGGFDEKFFMYVEESDWQRRIRDAGWSIRFTPAATVIHLAGASAQAGPNEFPRINRHIFQSLDYYERKHHGLVGLIALRLAMIIGCSLRLPVWSCVFLFMPRRRRLAAAKVRLLSWLCYRQSTCWHVSA